ncbi:hypothetical protein AAES_162569 [Amazona aestiva]|uniref:Laminin G domain-containing protein n=1 Tax=Amazona aestiva TaxID=12930 RepID=A0A0Q3PCH7_AMAAE|nr:hypothetical protein AAES_162569 [Amazona aestiva]
MQNGRSPNRNLNFYENLIFYENEQHAVDSKTSPGSGLNDGQWHEVRFLAKENFAVLTIDGDEASAVRTNSPLQVKTGEKYFFGVNSLENG